mmetsp:Transcript_9344/g.15220  ORF Transcript_9344/g.15220 Transcript_9344/m.15220 type:complete len:262 (+) Transcript_9344:190-975(+)
MDAFLVNLPKPRVSTGVESVLSSNSFKSKRGSTSLPRVRIFSRCCFSRSTLASIWAFIDAIIRARVDSSTSAPDLSETRNRLRSDSKSLANDQNLQLASSRQKRRFVARITRLCLVPSLLMWTTWANSTFSSRSAVDDAERSINADEKQVDVSNISLSSSSPPCMRSKTWHKASRSGASVSTGGTCRCMESTPKLASTRDHSRHICMKNEYTCADALSVYMTNVVLSGLRLPGISLLRCCRWIHPPYMDWTTRSTARYGLR